MAKITIVGDAAVITSTKKFEDIQLLNKYRPKALTLYDEEQNPIFCMMAIPGPGGINANGIVFGGTTHDDARLATLTMAIPSDVGDAKKYVADLVGVAILNVKKIEEQMDAALAEVIAEKAAIEANITVA